MVWIDAGIALLIALGLGLLLVSVASVRSPWAAPWALFLLLFLLVWAGGTWLTPFGPPAYGMYWAPFVLMGLVAVLLVGALSSAWRGDERVTRGSAEAADGLPRPEREPRAGAGLTAAFWVLSVLLVAAIVAAYL